jgi:hypothetical protein
MANNTNFKISDDIREAQKEMAKLNVALKDSVNIDTGKFDLSKFDHSLKKAGTSLT